MHTRLLVIGAFLCAAVLPAVLAASAYAQARHDPCLWSADYCSPLDNVLFAGAIFRAYGISLLAQALTLAALVFWQWRAGEDIQWPSVLGRTAFFVAVIVITWWLSQQALLAYAQFYYSVPAGAAPDTKVVVDFHKQLDKTLSYFLTFGVSFLFITGTTAILYGVKLWKALDLQELEEEIAVHEVRQRHERPEATH